jgi:flagellar hook-basal body complex protein FliE
MTDNKIGPTIRPVGEPRPGEKPAHKAPGSGQDFQATLNHVQNELNQADQQKAAVPAGTDTKSILDAAAAEQARFESMMRARQQISQAYLDIKSKPTSDKG